MSGELRTNPFPSQLLGVDVGRDNKVQSYTPTWSSSGVQPSIGTGTLTGCWAKRGDLVLVSIIFVAGATTNFGTGGWSFSLPLNAGRSGFCGTGFMIHGGQFYQAISNTTANSSTLQLYYSGSGQLSATVPWVWVNGDAIAISLEYPIR